MAAGLKELIEISNLYGQNKDFVIAGGGNTSYKDDKNLYVKASGTSLGTITKDGFAVLNREKLNAMSSAKYSKDVQKREVEVGADLIASSVYPERGLKPSVEASLHGLLDYTYVIHTHHTYINAVTCSKKAKSWTEKLYGKETLYIKYVDPGFVLYKYVEKEILAYREKYKKDPKVIILENHGIFVSANSVKEVKSIYNKVIKATMAKIKDKKAAKEIAIDPIVAQVLPGMRLALSTDDDVRIMGARNNSLIQLFAKDKKSVAKISKPFSPDGIVYCGVAPLFVDAPKDAEKILEAFDYALPKYRKEFGKDPKIIIIKGIGMFSVDDNAKAAAILLDVFEDAMKIAKNAANFGGAQFMSKKQIDFILNWEAENYRRKVSTGAGAAGRVINKVVVVTGGAQGFGGGIVDEMFAEGANLVIADLNEKVGKEKAAALNATATTNKAVFVKANVADDASVQNLMVQTVIAFGGLDTFVSNAGILRAGGLDEMTPESFSLMTKVNYEAYFLCAKHVSTVFKAQNRYSQNHFMDLIQINSKSGLKGSNKNFAYAGGKFGGIGLTQSFAMELMPFNVKVNSICPGNFFDGPLWSDPKTGLFVQYLKAGKVKGAKKVADVKAFYEAQVPAGRGCEVGDVMKAVYYVIEQNYETGQAIPVTGGQNMLN